MNFSVNYIFSFPLIFGKFFYYFSLCRYNQQHWGVGALILTIWGRGGDSLLTTWAVFGELSFEYFWGFSEIDTESAVVFLGTSGGGV